MPTATVLDSSMYFEDNGYLPGVPVVFLHGNPTSSFLWRNILPDVGRVARCLGPDLIGMGRSGKPAGHYRFADHARYLDAWFDALGIRDVVLVGHDWGAALACDWAASNPARIRGLVFMEGIIRPMSWSDLSAGARALFESYRTPGVGEDLVLGQNVFIELALPRTVASGLASEDLDAYRAPFPTPESRRPILEWVRQLPIDGFPPDVVRRVEDFDQWLGRSHGTPKLLLDFEPGPGSMTTPEVVAWCREAVVDLSVTRCGPAGHHAPEDQPAAIAGAIISWLRRHDLT
jgi:haloalkane dehalogenase